VGSCPIEIMVLSPSMTDWSLTLRIHNASLQNGLEPYLEETNIPMAEIFLKEKGDTTNRGLVSH